MNRREFLHSAMLSTLAFGVSHSSPIFAQCGGQRLNKGLLTDLMLLGGPDMRHVFPPAFVNSPGTYGYEFWRHRARAYALADSATDWANHWSNHFYHRSAGGVQFGILKSCEWLKQRWDAGELALICNAVGSKSRDHAHSILVMDQGNLESGPNDLERSGWGGRLASLANANCVSLTYIPRPFCFGLHPSGNINLVDNSNLVAASDTRRLGLYEHDTANNPRYDTRGRIARTLKSYYAGKRPEVSQNSIYHRFMESERKVREFGQKINDILACVPIPDDIRALYEGVPTINNGEALLFNTGFGVQIRNLYDAIAANQDLNMRVASMEYGGWDSHGNQKNDIEPKLEDIFGLNKGFDSLWKNLTPADRQNLVIVISGEFGRQLKDNGGNGTDHGRGNVMMVIGEKVNGGVYGDMFPDSELAKLGDNSPDIDGLTEFDHIFGAVCDWVHPGSASGVFPNKNSAIIETAGMFTNLLV